MRIEASQARARIGRLVERIAGLEAALEQCRTLATKARAETALDYCEQIERVAETALERSLV
jgi:hypothetical protein